MMLSKPIYLKRKYIREKFLLSNPQKITSSKLIRTQYMIIMP